LRLYFSTYGQVQKAWLQHFGQGQTHAKIHRGFGFVIFCEARSVDQLLGNDSSRFVKFDNGPRVEVKRAVSHCDIEDSKCPMSTPRVKRAHGVAQRHGVTGEDSPAVCVRDGDACEVNAVHTVGWSENTNVTPMRRRSCEIDYSGLSRVSPMPTDCSSASLVSGGEAVGSFCHGSVHAVLPKVPPMPILRTLSSTTQFPARELVDPFSLMPLDMLLKDLVGKWPCELAMALTQAAPDHYDD
jgi:hypothetical protein